MTASTLGIVICFSVVICILVALLIRQTYLAKKITTQLSTIQKALIESQTLEQKLREEARLVTDQLQSTLRDPVTHLISWPLFEDRLKHAIEESKRYQFTPGVLFVDLDDFHITKDVVGYEVADSLLREAGQRLQNALRQVDSVSRFSKDTFVILLAQLAKPETAAIVALRVLKSLAQPFVIANQELYLTACIGIAIYPDDGADPMTLLHHADDALHIAKQKNKNSYHFYHEEMYAKSQQELALYNSLNSDSIFLQFFIRFQPIINVDTKQIVGLDTHLLWQNPGATIMNSKLLLEYAEKQRKLLPITLWMLRSACEQFQKFAGLNPQPALLGITLSMRLLENSQFIYQVSQILHELNFPPQTLLMEIQDVPVQIHESDIEKSFNRLQYLGVKLGIEDFGAGLFSLCHLKNYPLQYLKFDNSLTEDIEYNPQAVLLVSSLINLADNMRMQVIAKQVNSVTQADALKKAGCTLMQGEHFGMPISADELVAKTKETSG